MTGKHVIRPVCTATIGTKQINIPLVIVNTAGSINLQIPPLTAGTYTYQVKDGTAIINTGTIIVTPSTKPTYIEGIGIKRIIVSTVQPANMKDGDLWFNPTAKT